MQAALTSLKRPIGPVRQRTIKVMMKINFSIFLLSKLCDFRLPGVSNNPCDSTEMLNIDEGLVYVDNKSKILQKSSILQIQNTSIPLKQCEVRIQCETRVPLTPKCETHILLASEYESHISSHKRDIHVLRQTQPTPEARVSTSKHEIRILPASKEDSRVFNSKRKVRIST